MIYAWVRYMCQEPECDENTQCEEYSKSQVGDAPRIDDCPEQCGQCGLSACLGSRRLHYSVPIPFRLLFRTRAFGIAVFAEYSHAAARGFYLASRASRASVNRYMNALLDLTIAKQFHI